MTGALEELSGLGRHGAGDVAATAVLHLVGSAAHPGLARVGAMAVGIVPARLATAGESDAGPGGGQRIDGHRHQGQGQDEQAAAPHGQYSNTGRFPLFSLVVIWKWLAE